MREHRSRLRGFVDSCWAFKSDIVLSLDFAAAALAGVVAGHAPTDADISRLAEPLSAAAIALGPRVIGRPDRPPGRRR